MAKVIDSYEISLRPPVKRCAADDRTWRRTKK